MPLIVHSYQFFLFLYFVYCELWASQLVLVVKNLPANAGDRRDSLGQQDPLEEETHYSIRAWRIPQTEEPGGIQSIRSHRVGNY